MMQTLWQAILFAFTGGIALWIGIDVTRNVQERTVTWINAPPGWKSVSGKLTGEKQWISRAEHPFVYWYFLFFKMIAFLGMATMAGVAGYSLLQL